MHLFILGATGGTGRALVEQASRGGHRVTALVRSPHELDAPAGVAVVKGDPRDAAQQRAAMAGCDAVISSLGPPMPPLRRSTILADGAKATVEAMAAAGVRRLLVVSSDLLFPDVARFIKLLGATILRNLGDDEADMERVTRASDLDWTIARPTRLTNGALTGVYRAVVGHPPPESRGISRADLAHFLLRAAERGEHVREIVGLAR